MGSDNPNIEGWSPVGSNFNGFNEPTETANSQPAWLIGGGTQGFLLQEFRRNAQDRIKHDRQDWRFAAELEVVPDTLLSSDSVWLETASRTHKYIMSVGLDADGDAAIGVVTVASRGNFEFDTIKIDADIEELNRFEFRYVNASDSADVYVNGNRVAQNYRSTEGTRGFTYFGVGIHAGSGGAKYSLVELTVSIPEPTHITAIAIFCGMALSRRGKRLTM